MVAGYRVIRKLGSSDRADVYLGSNGAGGGTHNSAVALKVFRPDAEPASIEREIRILSAALAGSLPELIDVATVPDGRVCLVQEWLAGGSLSRLLREGAPLLPGEAVTILAPVAVAIAALHRMNVFHASLGLASIMFDARGRPVLTGMGALGELSSAGDPPPASETRRDLLREDYCRFTALMRGVFDHLDPVQPVARQAELVAARFEIATGEVPFRPRLDELERALFDWAPAMPVGLTGSARREPAVLADAAQGAKLAEGLRREALRVELHQTPPLGVDASTPLQHPGARMPHWLEFFHLPHDVNAWISARRRPLVVAGLVAASGFVLALALLPPTGGHGEGDAGPRAAADGEAAPGTYGEPSVASAADQRALTDALEGDDPVAGVSALLELRAACLAAASVVCLDGVDQAGSAMMAADSYSVRMVQQGGSDAGIDGYDAFRPSLVEQSGNSALVALLPIASSTAESQPASALVVKGEAGWRLREIFDY